MHKADRTLLIALATGALLGASWLALSPAASAAPEHGRIAAPMVPVPVPVQVLVLAPLA